MFNRIKRIIIREKINNPSTPGLILFIQSVIVRFKKELSHRMMYLKKDGTFASSDIMFMCSLFPRKVLELIVSELKPLSVLDVGCGTGVSLKYFLSKNIDALGVENSSIAIEKSGIKSKIIKHNLNKKINLNREFDLVWSFEVIEHIHPDYESVFLQTLINHSSTIIISAARPGQGGHGHFNEKEPSYWKEKFKALGYHYDEVFSDKLISTGDNHAENLLCFKKV